MKEPSAAAAWVLAGVIALAGAAVYAFEGARLEIAHIQGEGWMAEGLAVDVHLPADGVQARLSVARLQVEPLAQALRDVRIDCPQLRLSATTIACRGARVLVSWPPLGTQRLTADLEYGRRDGALELAVAGLALDRGEVDLRASLRAGGWQGAAQLRHVPLQRLLDIAQALELAVPLASAEGLVDLSAEARGAGGQLRQAVVEGSLHDATANNDSGSLASDKLSLDLQAHVRRAERDWEFSLQLRSSAGQAYVQPIFLDLAAHALALRAAGTLREGHELVLREFSLDHAQIAQASGQARLDLEHEQPLRSLILELKDLQLPGAYASYFQPLLLDTNFKALTTAGRVSGRIHMEEGAMRSLDLHAREVGVDDEVGSLALAGLSAEVHWRSQEAFEAGAAARADEDEDRSKAEQEGERERTPDGRAQAEAVRSRDDVRPSRISWRTGALFGLQLGASELHFRSAGRQLRLLQPARIPLLDGAIRLERFRIRDAGTPHVAFLVDAAIDPISVSRLCEAFGWPPFGGRIGGEISQLRMREGVITLGTTLHAQVFDGEVAVSDLRLERPFGQWPRFYSSIAIADLDLELVTEAFSFGRITGRLSGEIADLQLFNWTPVAFDARLYTPADDRSRHRISQRAVENIGSIGGGSAGVTAALSSGFLRFFDEFNYDRLGWSCRLENEICIMDGIAPAPHGGYYLVKGKGLPRIDVIGSSRRVDWPRLVQQLIAVTESSGPVID